MAGTLIRVLPKTEFNMVNVSTLPVETALNAFDCTIYPGLIMIARIHAKSTTATLQTLNIYFRNLAPSIDDIAAEFVGATIGTGTFTISGGTAGVQTPQIVPCSGAISYRVRLFIACTQATSAAPFTFSLSVDALGRE